jgi:2-hydroxycyclohexanecarboxyl-CoA dehydrogenase
VALVTGGASGIGLAIAHELHACGARVALADVNGAGATSAAASLAGALGVEMDVTSYASVNRGFTQVRDSLGPVELLVANAGIERIQYFADTEPSFWERVIAVNLTGVLNCCHIALNDMRELQRGAIVITASDAGKIGSSGEAVYSATKGGVIAFGRSLAREEARYGIRVNSICPGFTQTPMLEGDNGPAAERLRAAALRLIPMRRLGQPEDIAPVASFLLSDEARWITGQAISVDGGLVMA